MADYFRGETGKQEQVNVVPGFTDYIEEEEPSESIKERDNEPKS
jgi:hypothetical protein